MADDVDLRLEETRRLLLEAVNKEMAKDEKRIDELREEVARDLELEVGVGIAGDKAFFLLAQIDSLRVLATARRWEALEEAADLCDEEQTECSLDEAPCHTHDAEKIRALISKERRDG